MIRILVVDDQKLIRVGIKVLLEKAAEIDIVGSVKDGEGALAEISEVQPDIVLLDIDLPGINGLKVARQINFNFPEVNVIMLSSHKEESYVTQAMNSGAKGYLLKSVSAEELEWSIKLVYQGYSAFKSELLSNFTTENKSKNPPERKSSTLSAPSLNSQQQISPRQKSPLSAPATTVTVMTSTPVDQNDAELAKMEAILTRNHIHRRYSKYAARDRHYRNNRLINDVKLNQIKKTMTSFEFSLLVFIILFALGILVFVALS